MKQLFPSSSENYETGWLEDDPFLLKRSLYRDEFAVGSCSIPNACEIIAKSLSVRKTCSLAGNLALWKVNSKSISFWVVVLFTCCFYSKIFWRTGVKSTTNHSGCTRCNHPCLVSCRELLAKAKPKNALGHFWVGWTQRVGAGFRHWWFPANNKA